MKLKSYLIIGTAVACFAGSFCWYSSVSSNTQNNEAGKAIPPQARPVPTTIVEEYSLTKARLFPGTVKATRSANLGFSVDGLLIEFKGLEGQPVKKGDILATIDQRDFQNNYEAAKASYKQAKAEFQRSETLLKRAVISQSEYDASKSTYEVALAQMNIRKKALDDTIITAPYDAIISKKFVENNEHIKKQEAILALQDISEIEVVIQVPEKLMAQGAIQRFKDIQVNFDADPSRWFVGKINEYSLQSDPVTRTFDVTIGLPQPTDLGIFPGMTGSVRTLLSTNPQKKDITPATIIPVEAVFTDPRGASYAWIIPKKGGLPIKQEIILGEMSDEGISILSGLKPGIHVATAGVHSLSETTRVRPMKEATEGLDG